MTYNHIIFQPQGRRGNGAACALLRLCLASGSIAGRRTRRETDKLCSDNVAGGRDGKQKNKT
jgi:hypothetical protein